LSAEIPVLWAFGARKEVFDLLQTLWMTGGPELRDQLATAIIAGPPPEALAHVDVEARERLRDRRIFDCLTIIERVGTPPPNTALLAEAARLHKIYPDWRAREGEQAHFATWIETGFGPDTRYGVDDLKELADEALINILANDQEMREGLLDAWRQLGNAEPSRVVSLLEHLARRRETTPVDVWERGLWGIRDAARQPELRTRLVVLLETLTPALFEHPDVSSAVCDILETVASSQPSPTNDQDFWRLFDRTALAIRLDPSNADIPTKGDWVGLAINRSMGKLTTAFFSALFSRELKVSGRLPDDLRPKLEALLAPAMPLHRLARVIAASRLSYLFAVDPDWAQAKLIPSFNWTANEEEALAVWQGYAWQPRIDRKLWSGLKPYFLRTFTPERIGRLGNSGRNLAQMLMLVGIEFGLNELPRDDVRNAIRSMPDEMRRESVSWIAAFLEQSKNGDLGDDGPKPPESKRHVDTLWTQRVEPWLGRVWPPEPAIRSSATAEQFALVAIATDSSFPSAVAAIAPYLVPTNGYYVFHRLAKSQHPDSHAAATLSLVDAIATPDALGFGDDLAKVLERVGSTDPKIAQGALFKTWNERLRARR
jgi:hypothetical protein